MTTLRSTVMSPGMSRPRLVGLRVSRMLVSSAGATAPVGITVVAGLRTSGLRSTRCVAYAGRMVFFTSSTYARPTQSYCAVLSRSYYTQSAPDIRPNLMLRS